MVGCYISYKAGYYEYCVKQAIRLLYRLIRVNYNQVCVGRYLIKVQLPSRYCLYSISDKRGKIKVPTNITATPASVVSSPGNKLDNPAHDGSQPMRC